MRNVMSSIKKNKLVSVAWLIYYSLFGFFAIFMFEIFGPEKKPTIIRLSPNVYGEYDPKLGIRYAPDTSISLSYLQDNGVVVECLQNISKTNSDGFRGIDTINEYASASPKIVVTGDSFSHWNNDGLTIVDLTKAKLKKSYSSISLINLAGGTFGLKHMFANVSEFVKQDHKLRPDLVLIQFIKDDIRRDWWVTNAFQDETGIIRARLANTEQCLKLDSNCGADEYIVNDRATHAWCTTLKDSQQPDELSREIIKDYSHIMGRSNKPILDWDSKTIDIAIRILRKLNVPFFGQQVNIPKISSLDDVNFQSMLAPIKELQASGTQVMMVFLPIRDEIEKQNFNLTKLEEDILKNIENNLEINIHKPSSFDVFRGIDEFAISPYDGHPSVELQNAYSTYIAERVTKELKGRYNSKGKTVLKADID
jgi:hypothetical protein